MRLTRGRIEDVGRKDLLSQMPQPMGRPHTGKSTYGKAPVATSCLRPEIWSAVGSVAGIAIHFVQLIIRNLDDLSVECRVDYRAELEFVVGDDPSGEGVPPAGTASGIPTGLTLATGRPVDPGWSGVMPSRSRQTLR